MSVTSEAVITHHSGRFNGREVGYTATVRPITVAPAGAGGPAAEIVSIDYLASDAGDPADRPVLFLCNGGPIVASVPLHVGAFGPRRVGFPDNLATATPDLPTIHNEHCLLDVADLVFFDPPGTGYSRVAEGTDAAAFAGVTSDAGLMAAWIQRWLRDHDRASSPVYLAGESYGTIRVATVAAELAARGVRLAGVCLISQATNIIETSGRRSNLTGYVVSLPTFAAIARYHGRTGSQEPSMPEVVEEASEFALTEYFPALWKGSRLPEAQRKRVARRLAELTGIPSTRWAERGLRLTKHEFRAELLAEENLVLHLYDGRFAGPPAKPANPGSIEAKMLGPQPEGADTVERAIDAAIDPYLHDFLGAGRAEEYVHRATGMVGKWSWAATDSPFGDWPYGDALTRAMTTLPDLRLLVCTGIHDLSTTIGAAEHAAAQCGWPIERVRLARYDGGHMMYAEQDSLTRLAGDVRDLIGRST
ncbi:S10 family peptidase [Amycolatopsis saalfeldensis]|uniref:Carboxypeptidase C (Cathepsin A) n=1 Tax=Amycolatopsis saalfeldensis TaxID=394193 RepID=A0A1H8XXU3_9PSEU|nr:peptidase S10 [Amycolatopsis saalfeldensis]SEP44583.1 Carboxypeptidase C (cathepsin A) [Amycolatopsis saalfeldensis]